MKARRKQTDHSGSTFDSFLKEAGIREEVEALVVKRVLAWQSGTGHAETAKDEGSDGKPASSRLGFRNASRDPSAIVLHLVIGWEAVNLVHP